MHIPKRFIDIEATNRCNATCNFCPRESTPKQGFMTPEVFEQVVKRILELGDLSQVKASFTGRGEPTLHPRIVDFISEVSSKGIYTSITTNGSRLTPKLNQQLLDAGINKVVFSVSDLNENYDEIYGLSFEDVIQRIEAFVEMARGKCEIQVTVVRHRWNKATVDETINFWKAKGIHDINIMREDNRSGTLTDIFEFEHKHHNREKAISLLQEKGLSHICSLPFFSVFFGWQGTYDLCCHDWQKTVKLGNVFDYSIEAIDNKKLSFVEKDTGACRTCSSNPINDVEELLYQIESGEKGKFAIHNKMKSLSTGRQHQTEMKKILDDLHYKTRIIVRSE